MRSVWSGANAGDQYELAIWLINGVYNISFRNIMLTVDCFWAGLFLYSWLNKEHSHDLCLWKRNIITISITKFIGKESLECIQLKPAVRMALNKLDLDLFFFFFF